MKLFSGKDSDSRKKNKHLRDKLKLALPIAGGVGIVSMNNGLLNGSIKDHLDTFEHTKITAKDSKKIMDSLLKKAKDQGIEVLNDPHFNNSAYLGGTPAKWTKKLLDHFKKQNPEKYKELVAGNEKLFDNFGKDAVLLGNGTLADVDILSHELGHAQYLKSGRSKNILAKAAHRLMLPSKLATSSLGQAGAFALGARSGYKTEKKRSEGKKVSLWDKTKPFVMPAAVVSPLLIAEGAASLNGLKMMKEAGASKELLKQSKKRLRNAWGTYAAGALKPVSASTAGALTGRTLARLQNKNNKSNDDPSGEKLYSVLMDEHELALFSKTKEEKDNRSDEGLEGALVGYGITGAGVGAAYGLGKGADWLGRKLGNRRYKSIDKLIEEMKNAGADAKKKEKLGEEADKILNNVGRLETWASRYGRATHKTQNWIKKNPGKASAIAYGVAALGAGTGYGISKLKNRKRNEE